MIFLVLDMYSMRIQHDTLCHAGGDSESSSESQKWWIKALHLADTDHQALVSGGELTDSLIMAAQTMLASQYPEIRGFQDTNKGRYLTFSGVSKNCVQIFYVGEL